MIINYIYIRCICIIHTNLLTTVYILYLYYFYYVYFHNVVILV